MAFEIIVGFVIGFYFGFSVCAMLTVSSRCDDYDEIDEYNETK